MEAQNSPRKASTAEINTAQDSTDRPPMTAKAWPAGRRFSAPPGRCAVICDWSARWKI